jgi:hypothetical protein
LTGCEVRQETQIAADGALIHLHSERDLRNIRGDLR